MTLERILLQTIKFDLQAEHPYAYLLKFAKLIKGKLVIAEFERKKRYLNCMGNLHDALVSRFNFKYKMYY